MMALFFQAVGVSAVATFGIAVFFCALIAIADAIARRRLRMELPKNGKLHFHDGPVVVVPGATPAAAIDRLITDGRRRAEYRGVWE